MSVCLLACEEFDDGPGTCSLDLSQHFFFFTKISPYVQDWQEAIYAYLKPLLGRETRK